MASKIGTGVLDVGFDPRQVEQAGREQLLPSGRRIAADLAATFAAVKLVDFGRQGLDELKEAEKQASNVSAVIKATGGAANVSADQIDQLANSQLKLTGVDDEIIKGGAAKLLTFRNVANQVGEGNDVFDRATKASLDLAQVGFGTVESSSVLLGKALNDPIAGMTALTRAGVTFSDAQKETIKGLVESGDLLGAQKLILGEVEHQVGGAAEAYGQTLPGKIDIAKQSLDNMKGSLIAAEAPLIELGASGVEFLSDKLQELPDAAQAGIGGVIAIGAAAGVALGPIRDAVQVFDILSARRAAKAGLDAADVAGNEAVAASQAELAATSAAEAAALDSAAESALAASGADLSIPIAAGSAAVSEEALAAALDSAAESALASTAGVDAAAVSNTALAGSAETATAAEAGLTIGVGALAAAFTAAVAVGYGLGTVIDNITNSSGFDKLSDDFAAVDNALKTVDGDISDFDAGTLTDKLNDLVRGNEDFSTALSHAGVTTGDFVLALSAGGESFDSFIDKVAHAKGVTDEDRVAFGALTTQINSWAENALNAAVATGQLDQATLNATTGLHLFADGSIDFVGVLEDLANRGLIAKEVVDKVKGAAEQEINTKNQEALANWYATIATNAEKAEAAALRLAPADIRVQRGALTIEQDKRAIDAAEARVKFLKASGASAEDIAKAEDELKGKRLDLEQATLDQAEAETELQKARLEAAGGVVSQIDQNNIYIGALSELTDDYNGPVHDALARYLLDTVLATNAQKDLLAAQDAARYAATHPNSPVPEPEKVAIGQPRAVASGGNVEAGEVFRGAEEGWEILLTDGLYRAPVAGTVLDHQASQRFATEMLAPKSPRPAPTWQPAAHVQATGGSQRPIVIERVELHGDNNRASFRRLPDELRSAAFLAGV